MYDGTFDQMQKLRIQPMIWSPLAGGKLFNEKTPENKRIVERLMAVAKTFGSKVTIDQVCFSWIRELPCKPVIILGTNDLKRMKKAADSLHFKLTKTQWFQILEAINGCEVP